MRARRSAKFAEYLSTYAILEHIGIHPTTLIEKRDAAVGVGVYVRDACDAGTVLLAVPSRRFSADSVLAKVGLQCQFTDPWKPLTALPSSTPCFPESPTVPSTSREDIERGIVSFLTGSAQWPELAWRLALERHRSVSPLWGWLQSLPSPEEFQDQTEAAERHCRVHYTMLLPYYLKGRQRIEAETHAAYRQLRCANVLPSYATFRWAVEVLLSRGLLVPLAWPAHRRRTTACSLSASSLSEGESELGDTLPAEGCGEDEAALELAVVPFVDLVNAPDEAGRVANAHLEVAATVDELPVFFREEAMAAAAAKGRDGLAELAALLTTHYYLCLTLQTPLRASEEVIVEWDIPVLTTGVLQSAEDQLVSRLLKYKY